MESPSRTYLGSGVVPARLTGERLNIPVNLPCGVSYERGTVLGHVPGTGTAANHRQTLTPGGTVSGGTWRIVFNGLVTSALAYDADADTIKTALAALANIGDEDNLTVTGGGLDAAPVVITFVGKMAGLEQPAITIISSLTGSSPTVTVTQTTKGKSATGLWAAYDDTASDGREVAKGVLQYPCATDTFGNITYGDTAGAADHGSVHRTAPCWLKGVFKTSELTGLDANGVADLGRLITGTTSTLTDANTLIDIR